MAGLQPGDQVDHFILRRPLGQGGMAMAYLAEDTRTGTAVVLKLPDVMQLGDAATFERFRRELAIGQKLQHPAAPRLVAAREDGNRPYLALEFIDGDTIGQRLQSGPLPVALVEDFARQLADLVAYCHRLGVVHRDLKPGNLIVDAAGRLHVIDFGIATVRGMARVTWRGFSGLAGTAEYMAPEKIRGERGTPRVDIYALGITLYEMLTGTLPFHDEHPLTTMHLHLTATATPVRSLRPETPEYLAAIIARCMRRRPEERYADGGALLADLTNPGQVDLTYLARPDPPLAGAATARKAEDNPLKFALITALAAVAVTLLLMFLLYRRR